MARLILMFNKQVIKEVPFIKDSVTIGRQGENTIVIDNLAVSGYHARIDKTGSDYVLTDLQSTNGTFINELKVTAHKLSHGDNIVIGKHVILFVASEKAEGGEPEKILELESRPGDRVLSFLSLHPEGQRIAFVKGEYYGQTDLWVMENLLTTFAADK